ncbi:MAG: hypothetical protein QHC79_09595 [Pseudosphingobacterium sp.]|uniref:Phage tail protein n=1 Tax=Sphingobacterium sp. (strain 21) TaxID=743722 RepID=F4C2D8_SPHS2|nr:hypothetical protein [Pseudosphingobacterium sp.]
MSRSYDNITDLKMEFVDGIENTSGIQEVAYFIPLSWMATVAEPAEDGTTAASLVEITANHVMKAGKAPIELQPMFEKSGATGAMEGEILSGVMKQGPADFFLPNLTASSLGTAGALKNYRGIVLFKRIGGGDFYQFGSKYLSAKVEAVVPNWGTGPTGEVGTKITFGAYGTMPAYIYKGELPVPAAP